MHKCKAFFLLYLEEVDNTTLKVVSIITRIRSNSGIEINNLEKNCPKGDKFVV